MTEKQQLNHSGNKWESQDTLQANFRLTSSNVKIITKRYIVIDHVLKTLCITNQKDDQSMHRTKPVTSWELGRRGLAMFIEEIFGGLEKSILFFSYGKL